MAPRLGSTRAGKVEPYDKIIGELPDMRHDTVELMTQAVVEKRRAYVLVNNRSEGNAPMTIQASVGMLQADSR